MMKKWKKVNRVTNDDNEEDHTRIENSILNYPNRSNVQVKGNKFNLVIPYFNSLERRKQIN